METGLRERWGAESLETRMARKWHERKSIRLHLISGAVGKERRAGVEAERVLSFPSACSAMAAHLCTNATAKRRRGRILKGSRCGPLQLWAPTAVSPTAVSPYRRDIAVSPYRRDPSLSPYRRDLAVSPYRRDPTGSPYHGVGWGKRRSCSKLLD